MKKDILKKLSVNGNIQRRLLDLGFVKGASIKPVLISPSKDPRAFEIRGSTIAIRSENAKYILVRF